jgi:hypothetical protein
MTAAPLTLLALAWLAQTGSGVEPPAPRYGDAGTSDVSLGIGYVQGHLLAAAGYRRFVWPGLGPGAEVRIETGGGTTLGLLLGSMRAVPVRTGRFALSLTARGGRAIVSDLGDGWALGGDAGLIVAAGSGVAFEVGYEALRLLPARFCAEFTSCWIQGPVLGVRILF